MADFLSELASKAGIDASMAHNGVGAVLSTLQKHVPAELYSKISSAIPNAGNILSTFQSSPGTTQGSGLSGLAAMAGGLLGGKAESATTLISQFSKAGFSLEEAKSFLPVLLEHLKSKTSPETMKQLEGAIPGLSPLLSGSGSAGLIDKLKNLF